MSKFLRFLAVGFFATACFTPKLSAQTLGDAVNATNLVWTTGGNKDWSYQTSVNFDGTNAAASGGITHNQETWMETTVTNPGTLSFWWKVTSEINNDFLEFYLAGVRQDRISGPTDWQYRTYEVPAGTNTLRWRYVKDGNVNFAPDKGWVDQVVYTTTPIPLGQALDTCGYTWTSGGNTNPTYWAGQTNTTHDGTDAAESGAVYAVAGAPQESWMTTTVTGATNVSFWWKVSSRTNDTWLEFYIGTTNKVRISGEVNWRSNSFALPTSTQTLKWRYLKSNSIPVGQDRGWVDQILITPNVGSPPTISTQPQSQTVDAGDTVALSVTASSPDQLTYQWRKEASPISYATNATLTLTNVLFSDGGDYSAVATSACGAGAVTSAVATLTVLAPPAISIPPQSQTVTQGVDVAFNVTANGTAPLRYQWRFNHSPISQATNLSLTLSNVQSGSAGSYDVVVTNVFGGVTSAVATLTVLVPPTISIPPQSQTVTQGVDVTFNVTAGGTAPLRYQWRFNNSPISQATNLSLTLSNVQSGATGSYSVVVTNVAGGVTSAVATLTVLVPPTISVPPASQTVTQGVTATFNVTANGTAPLRYQWRFNNSPISQATNLSLTLSNVQLGSAGSYDVVVTNVAGGVTSAVATLTVLVPPTISIPPVSQTVTQGVDVTFNVTAGGTAPLRYQWRLNNSPIFQATNLSLTLSNVQSGAAGSYSVVVTNVAGGVTSAVATLMVLVPPTISVPPASQTVTQGVDVTFNVSAGGTEPLRYQWRFDGTEIGSATNASLTLSNVQSGAAGSYDVVVTNVVGSVTSAVATLTVFLAPPTISIPPQSQTVTQGADVTFNVTAGGTEPLRYQWRFDGTELGSATNTSLTLSNVQLGSAGSYDVVVTNLVGSVTSAVATLTVLVPPTISIPPQSQTVTQGVDVTFNVTAGGTEPLRYRWRFNNSPISQATNLSLTLSNVQFSNVGNYDVVVTNVAGAVTSIVATLILDGVPSLRIAVAGENTTLSWPVTPSSFQLQVSGSVTNSWMDVPDLPATNGLEISTSLPQTSTNQFFRLRKN